jgi:hypothetical protein
MIAQVVAEKGTDTAAWLAFTGAIVVASIAAITAQLRQRAQLRHDRKLHDLTDARVALEETVTEMWRINEGVIRATGLMTRVLEHERGGSPGSDEELNRAKAQHAFLDEWVKSQTASHALSLNFVRLSIRFGKTADVTRTFEAVWYLVGRIAVPTGGDFTDETATEFRASHTKSPRGS